MRIGLSATAEITEPVAGGLIGIGTARMAHSSNQWVELRHWRI